MIYLLSAVIIGLGVKLIFFGPVLYITKYSANINFGEYHVYIGILIIIVGVALFVEQKRQKK